MTLFLELEALADLSLSTGNHSFGQADSHDYIPGRTLWGAIASAAYQAGMAEEVAFRLFHQGGVRVSDGVPLVDGQRCYPSPASWHHPKEQPDGTLKNFVFKSMREKGKDPQHKPKSVGWTTADGKMVTVLKNYSLRTAVDSTGKARDGLLYGLPVIRAGTRFSARLDGAETDLKELRRFVEKRDLRLGRSRNSELGLVRASVVTAPQALPHGSARARSVSFLCVSRCVFRNSSTGAPCLIPEGADLGLPADWKLDETASFVRSTRVVHFNSKRNRPEAERFAIEKGSVLTFGGPGEVALNDIVCRVQSGVGEFSNQGYGEVLVAPEWLTKEEFRLGWMPEPAAEAVRHPSDELFAWAARRGRERAQSLSLYEQASKDAKSLRPINLPNSQWGAVRAIAREARFPRDPQLFDKLLGAKGYLREGKRRLSPGWKRALPQLEDLCKGKGEQLPTYLEFLASACMRPEGQHSEGETK